MRILKFSVLLTLIAVCGCATIVRGPRQNIPLNTTPAGATVTITDEDNNVVFTGITPTTVTLEKKKAYFKGKNYTLSLKKPGYTDTNLAITSTAGGWYIAGNFFFGGLIGWFIVDPLTGSMYTLEPKEVNQSLQQSIVLQDNNGNTLPVVPLDAVPHELRDKMQPVQAQ